MSILVRLLGEETNANDPLEVWVQLAAIPRKGEQIEVWDGSSEVWAKVADVSYPAWEYAHDPGVQSPAVTLYRPGGITDDEWRDFFAAIKEGRHP